MDVMYKRLVQVRESLRIETVCIAVTRLYGVRAVTRLHGVRARVSVCDVLVRLAVGIVASDH